MEPVADDAGPGAGLLRIADAARAVGVSPSALRLWEQQGLVSPRRVGSRERRYGPAELERLHSIRRLRAVEGLNAAGIRRVLGAAPARDASPAGARPAVGPGRAPESGPLGPRLRRLRVRARLPLREVARRAGLSPSFVSGLERGTTGASVAALVRLAAAYGTSVAALVGGTDTSVGPSGPPARPADRLVRSGDRRAVEAGRGVRIEDLAATASQLQPQLFVLAPGASSEGAYDHQGEEFLFVLEGRVAIWLADQARRDAEYHELGPGDALTFASSVPHRFVALGDDETRILWVNTPPTF